MTRRLVCFIAGLAIFATSTAQADVVWTAGAPGGTSGGALQFEGDTADALLTGIQAATLTGDRGNNANTPSDYTVGLWINSDTGASNEWFLGNDGRGVHLGIQNGGGLTVGHWSADNTGSTTVAAGTWVHATFTYDADGGTVDPVTGVATGLQTVYFNGVSDGGGDNAAPLESGGQIQLGSRRGTIGPAFDGAIDDVAIWNSVLTAEEIRDLADGTQTALALGAEAYYDFEDDVFGTTAAVQGTGTLGAIDLQGITANVPEPSSLALLLGLGGLGFLRRKRS